MQQILELIAYANAVVATGHVSAEEVCPSCERRASQEVGRVVVNHPEIAFLPRACTGR